MQYITHYRVIQCTQEQKVNEVQEHHLYVSKAGKIQSLWPKWDRHKKILAPKCKLRGMVNMSHQFIQGAKHTFVCPVCVAEQRQKVRRCE